MKCALVSLFTVELELVGLVSVSGQHTAPLFSNVFVTSMLGEKKDLNIQVAADYIYLENNVTVYFSGSGIQKKLKRLSVQYVDSDWQIKRLGK